MGILSPGSGEEKLNDGAEMAGNSSKVSRTSFGISVGLGLLGDWVAGHDWDGELESRTVVVV